MANVDTEAFTTLARVAMALLRSDGHDILAEKVFDQSGDYTEEGVRSIHAATNEIQAYLKREVIIREIDVLLRPEDWVEKDRTPDSDYIYRLSLPRVESWPVYSSPQDIKIWGDRKIFAKDRKISKLTYFAGYRREDQTLNDLPTNIQNEFGSEDEITIIPRDIEDVCINLAIHSAVLRLKDLIGTSRMEQSMGDFQTTVTRISYEQNYKKRQLNNIQDERYFI